MIDSAEYWRQAREALAKGDSKLAADCLEQAIHTNPDDVEAYRALGRVLRLTGRTDEAAACYRRCLEIARDDGVATMGLAALGKAPVPPRLPEDVVLYVFDRNAGSYEANMRSLGYSAPQTLVELLRTECGAPGAHFDVLDLGCGSGLCGPLLRPFARRLVGVDLSPRMLAIAKGKGVYDELVEAEILKFVSSEKTHFNIVVAANVLCYFGDLAPLAQGVSQMMRPGGRFLFDVEKRDGTEAGFHVSGRYTHSLTAIEDTLLRFHLDLARIQETVMRTERGAPVLGLHCAARRHP